MLILVYGGSGSGKSEFAESLVMKSSQGCKKRIYIATMKIYDDEALTRVERHKAMRASKGFETIECQKNLENIWKREKNADELQDSVVLLECISNLLANEMFDDENDVVNMTTECKTGNDTDDLIEKSMDKSIDKTIENSLDILAKKISESIMELSNRVKSLIVVSNNIFDDGIDVDDSTKEYMRVLAKINNNISKNVDSVIEVVAGIPIVIK